MPRHTVLVCGSLAFDRIMNFSGQFSDLIEPAQLHVLSVSVLVDSLKQAEGGTGGNIAYNLSLLAEKPLLLASAGEDARSYIDRLGSLGVDISRVHYSRLPTASFNVLTDSNNNQVGGFYPGAMADAKQLSLGQAPSEEAVVCLSAHDPSAMRRQTEESARLGYRLVYDPGQQVVNVPVEDLMAGIEAAAVLMVNDYELGLICKRTATTQDELRAKVPLLVTTHGKQGSIISGQSVPETIEVGIATANKVVDPTGAGDAYRAGFLYGYLRQWKPEACARLGAVMASFVLEQYGPQVDITVPAVLNRYRETFKEEIAIG